MRVVLSNDTVGDARGGAGRRINVVLANQLRNEFVGLLQDVFEFYDRSVLLRLSVMGVAIIFFHNRET